LVIEVVSSLQADKVPTPGRPMSWAQSAWRQKERLYVPLLLLAAWELFSRSGYLPPSLLPAPSRVIWTLADWVFAIDESTQSQAGHWWIDAMASAPDAAAFVCSHAAGQSVFAATDVSAPVDDRR
jgi:ABC-type nitrate/sulfonate/bicarbonate transport system permease component